MKKVFETVALVAPTEVTVLISGESGTGKELVANAIHHNSPRGGRPFIKVNCAALPEPLLESELFGHEKGAFTGAVSRRKGRFQLAHGSSILLDEIAEMAPATQAKILRVLQERSFEPVGGSETIQVDTRVIAATNRNLEEEIRAGRFREDLFYRLNVFRLRVPPLRERRDEIPGLVRHFVAQSAAEFKKGDVRVADETMEHLLLCRWPGNIRQLQNEIRRMVALAKPNAVLAPRDLSEDVFNARLAQRPAPNEFEMVVWLKGKLLPTLTGVEREMIRLALRDHQGKLDAAARALGISRKGLYLKRQRLRL
jgi:transcriptional regulator with GAF, ATPase, and Fis domain